MLYTLHRLREPLISMVSIPVPIPVPFPCSVYERSVIKHHHEIADRVQNSKDLNFKANFNASDTALIDNNGVAPNWDCNPFWSDSIQALFSTRAVLLALLQG